MLGLLHRGSLALVLLTRQHANQLNLHSKKAPPFAQVECLGGAHDLSSYLAHLFVVLLKALLPLLPLKLTETACKMKCVQLLLYLRLKLVDSLVELLKVDEVLVVLPEVGVENFEGYLGVQHARFCKRLEDEVLHALRNRVGVHEFVLQLRDGLLELF